MDFKSIKIKLIAAGSIAALLAAGCAAQKSYQGTKLPTLGTSQIVDLKDCPTPKCLTVYVAPWCPHCRTATPLIQSLREYLKARNITTRVVVGKDKPQALKDYAATFGPDTLLDLEDKLGVEGVPNFTVSDASGRILRSEGGAPEGIPQPWDDSVMAEVAQMYGLP